MRHFIASALVGMSLLVASASAQSKRPPRPPVNGMIERLSHMTPEQRQQALEKLPPERRQRVERRLEEYNALPPEVRNRLRDEYQAFQKLPADRQEAVRRSFRQFQRLPDDRRPMVRRELMRLRQMTPEERAARTESENFRSRFNESERQLLLDLSVPAPPKQPD